MGSFFVGREIDIKTKRIVELLKRAKYGGILLNAQHNFAWITGGATNAVDISRENGVATIFVRDDGTRFILANSIEMPRVLAEEVSPNEFEPIEFAWQEEKASADILISMARRLTDNQIVTDLTIHASAASVENLVAPCRYSLTPEEIERYRSLGKDVGDAVEETAMAVRPGQSETAIAAKLRWKLAEKNINSVVTLVAADGRIAKFRHPVPGANRWQKVLLLVTCAKRHGLVASVSRMICVGIVPSELQERTESAAFVNASLLNATRPGTSGSELYEIAKNVYEFAGFPDEIARHHQGGAAGYKTRDWVAHPANREIVNADQAFAWNPSITGTKVEDTVIVTEEGVETITTSAKFPVITTAVGGRNFESAGILSV